MKQRSAAPQTCIISEGRGGRGKLPTIFRVGREGRDVHSRAIRSKTAVPPRTRLFWRSSGTSFHVKYASNRAPRLPGTQIYRGLWGPTRLRIDVSRNIRIKRALEARASLFGETRAERATGLRTMKISADHMEIRVGSVGRVFNELAPPRCPRKNTIDLIENITVPPSPMRINDKYRYKTLIFKKLRANPKEA